jgi:hypothetical protein
MTITESMHQAAAQRIVRNVAIKTVLLAVAAAIASAAVVLYRSGADGWWRIPAGLLFGAGLGIVNFKWLAVAIERLYLKKGTTPGIANIFAIVTSILKLSVVFIVLFVVIKMALFHIFGLVAGLSLSFLAIFWEGSHMIRQVLHEEQ